MVLRRCRGEGAVMGGGKDQPSVPTPLWGRIRSGPLKVNSPPPPPPSLLPCPGLSPKQAEHLQTGQTSPFSAHGHPLPTVSYLS